MIIKLMGILKEYDSNLSADGELPLKRERVIDTYFGVDTLSHSYRLFQSEDGVAGYSKSMLRFTIKGVAYNIDTSQYAEIYIMNDEGKTVDRY